jgi:hypothetical protein
MFTNQYAGVQNVLVIGQPNLSSYLTNKAF